mgnify:CR=1 FL=1
MEDMICGGIYEYKDSANRVLHGTLVGVTTHPNGRSEGTILFAGFAPEHVEQKSDRWDMMKLIGRPASPKVGRPRKG